MTDRDRHFVLTEADKSDITEMADRGLTVGRIARKLGRHAATVNWFCLQNGLVRVHLDPARGGTHTTRSGRVVRRYSEAEDRLVLKSRLSGMAHSAIAAVIEQTFGHRRTAHSISVRLTMLANTDWADAVSDELLQEAA